MQSKCLSNARKTLDKHKMFRSTVTAAYNLILAHEGKCRDLNLHV